MKRLFFREAFVLILPLASAAAAQEPAGTAGAYPPSPNTNLGWVMGANLVIWGGIALYLMYLHSKASALEKNDYPRS